MEEINQSPSLPDSLTIEQRILSICLWAYENGLEAANSDYKAASERIFKHSVDPVNFHVAVGREVSFFFSVYNEESKRNRFLNPLVGLNLNRFAAAYKEDYLNGLEDAETDKLLRDESRVTEVMADIQTAVWVRVMLRDLCYIHEAGYKAWKANAMSVRLGKHVANTFTWQGEVGKLAEIFKLYVLLLEQGLIAADTEFSDFYGIFSPNSIFQRVRWTGKGNGRLIYLFELLLINRLLQAPQSIMTAVNLRAPLTFDTTATLYTWLYERIENCFTDREGNPLTKVTLKKARDAVKDSCSSTPWRVEMEFFIEQYIKNLGR